MKRVAAAVVYLEGKVLITRRAPGEKLAGLWEFPGGKLEADETPQHCIVREIHEELRVGSIAGDILTESVFTYPGDTIQLVAVELTLNSTNFVLQVHDRVEWCLPRELLSYELAPADIPIAMEIIRKYG